MNQINGYCQIELPDRISIKALNSAGVGLTDAEVKTIMKALNLDQVKVDAVGYPSYINAWLNKPVIVKAHFTTDEDGRDVKSIFHASTISAMMARDTIVIEFVAWTNDGYRIVVLNIVNDAGADDKNLVWSIQVRAYAITTTNIE